jgi:uncharacterized membrane protein
MARIALAFLLFPVPAALVRALAVWRWPSEMGGIFAHPASMFVAMCLLIYVLELVLGAPILLAMRHNGREGAVDYAAAGLAVLAIPSILVVVALALLHRFAWATLFASLLAACCGVVGGALFWALARPRRRDYVSVFD